MNPRERKRNRDVLSPPTPTQIQDKKKSNVRMQACRETNEESAKESDGEYESSVETVIRSDRTKTQPEMSQNEKEERNNETEIEVGNQKDDESEVVDQSPYSDMN